MCRGSTPAISPCRDQQQAGTRVVCRAIRGDGAVHPCLRKACRQNNNLRFPRQQHVACLKYPWCSVPEMPMGFCTRQECVWAARYAHQSVEVVPRHIPPRQHAQAQGTPRAGRAGKHQPILYPACYMRCIYCMRCTFMQGTTLPQSLKTIPNDSGSSSSAGPITVMLHTHAAVVRRHGLRRVYHPSFKRSSMRCTPSASRSRHHTTTAAAPMAMDPSSSRRQHTSLANLTFWSFIRFFVICRTF